MDLLPYVLVTLIIILGACIGMIVYLCIRNRFKPKTGKVQVFEDQSYSQKKLAASQQSERHLSYDRYPVLPEVIHQNLGVGDVQHGMPVF